jgi:hypothetical protein
LLAACKSLQKLVLESCHLTPYAVRSLGVGLQRCKYLEYLSLAHNADMMKELKIESSDYTNAPSPFNELMDSIQDLPSLKYLSI